jgi:O-6-methylguanine DNA methyltransferase
VNISSYIFPTGLGWAGLSCSDKGLRRLILPTYSFEEVCRRLDVSIKPDGVIPQNLDSVIERLKLYFNGYKVDFPDRLDLSGSTAFQLKVWEITRFIPFGKTKSYTWVAEQAGKAGAVRAVGQALGKNPLPIIIPCHRVIAKNGSIGGYEGGADLKKHLIRLEASALIRRGVAPGQQTGQNHSDSFPFALLDESN